MISINNTGFESIRGNLQTNSSNLIILDESLELNNNEMKIVNSLINSQDIKIICFNILKKKYGENMTLQDLDNIIDTLEILTNNLRKEKDRIEIKNFISLGHTIDITELRKEYNKYGVDKIFPKFNFKRLKELYENPPLSLLPRDNSSSIPIPYEPFVTRKFLEAIIQMVINEMDLHNVYTGSEGSGKSCACSQDMNLLHFLLTELGLITYEYEIGTMWASKLSDFHKLEDDFFHEKFRIIGLDEGNELNRHDWQLEDVKTYFQRLRRERYNQRIKLMCIPHIGELLTGIFVRRMNFVFEMKMKSNFKTKTLSKGDCYFYILPRGSQIFSPEQKRIISQEEVIDSMGEMMENKKKHLQKLPFNTLIKKYKRNHIWGFDRNKYNKELKDKNKSYTVSKGVGISELMAYWYYKCRPNLAKWDIDRKENPDGYAMLHGLDKALCKRFEDNPNLLEKYEKLIERKRERKAS